jgi:Protein of unknown function (DUF2958)
MAWLSPRGSAAPQNPLRLVAMLQTPSVAGATTGVSDRRGCRRPAPTQPRMSITHELRPALRLFAADQRAALVGTARTPRRPRNRPYPVVKLFLPSSRITWLLTELGR